MVKKLLPLALLIVMGCGGRPQTPVFAVSGKVLLGDKPLPNATVVFHPENAAENAPRFRATTAADGRFEITSVEGKAGAPEGHYRVTVEQWLAGALVDDGPSNRLPAKYASPDRSGLSAIIVPGTNELAPFVLKK